MWKSGFYNSVNGDRSYNAVEISERYDGLIKDGIYPSVGNKLEVQPNSGMTIQIASGRAEFVNRFVKNTDAYPETLEDADVTLNRYVAICVQIDNSEEVRDGVPYAKYSEFATSPVKPEMDRDAAGISEFCLGYIYIYAGMTEVTADDIEDTRDDEDLCGYASIAILTDPEIFDSVDEVNANSVNGKIAGANALKEYMASTKKIVISETEPTDTSAIWIY